MAMNTSRDEVVSESVIEAIETYIKSMRATLVGRAFDVTKPEDLRKCATHYAEVFVAAGLSVHVLHGFQVDVNSTAIPAD